MSALDRVALRQGASVALVFAVPFSIGARVAADSSSDNPLALLLSLAALAGFTLGAGVAAWVQRSRLPLLHGMVCAGGTYLAAQAAFVIVKLVRGGEVKGDLNLDSLASAKRGGEADGPAVVPGDVENLKVTWPGDFALAARLLETR